MLWMINYSDIKRSAIADILQSRNLYSQGGVAKKEIEREGIDTRNSLGHLPNC